MDKAYELNLDELGSVPLNLIDPDPEQPRKDFDEDYIHQLAASIKKDGVIQPIVVRKNPDQPGRFFIVAGENRWRASRLAKTKTIPAVLREVEGLSKLIIQLKENHQRMGLNPMEWAQALQTMNKVHGLKQAEIEKTLKESGVGQFGRAYISNMIRLLDLPEWAQDLIRRNKLTAAHGKHLLQAMASELVMEKMHNQFQSGWEPTTRELQSDIYRAFNHLYIDLNGWQTSFDYREKCVKTGCQKMRKISGPDMSVTFCLDEECHAILQAEAKKEARANKQAREPEDGGEGTPREIVISEDNRVNIQEQQLLFHRDYLYLENADFDTSGCEGCKHRHIAIEDDDTEHAEDVDSCFLLSCYLQKEDMAKRARWLLSQFMRKEIVDCFEGDEPGRLSMLAWSAAGAPNGINRIGDDEEEFVSFGIPLLYEDDIEKILFKHRMVSLYDFMTNEEGLQELFNYAINELDGYNLLILYKFRVSDDINHYRIDEHYLAEHTEEELMALLNTIEWPAGSYAELTNAQNEGNLDQFIKDNADVIGVPAEIRYAYKQLNRGNDHE